MGNLLPTRFAEKNSARRGKPSYNHHHCRAIGQPAALIAALFTSS